MSASTTRKIGGVLLKPDATPFANSSLTIYRDKREVVPQGDAAIVDEVLRTVTGPGGEVSMALVPGKYLGQIRLSDVDRYFQFTVPDGAGPFVIADLIETSPISGAQYLTLLDLVTTARAWAEKPEDEEVVENGYSALHWAAKAEEARAGAELAQSAAEGAQLAAEDAADRAEYAATVIENPVSYAPQTLSPAERSQARENIAALSYEIQSLDSGQQEQARANIGIAGPAPRATARIRREWLDATRSYDVIEVRGPNAALAINQVVNPEPGQPGVMRRIPVREFARIHGVPIATNSQAFRNADGSPGWDQELLVPNGLCIAQGQLIADWDSGTNAARDQAVVMFENGQLAPAYRDSSTGAALVAAGARFAVSWGAFCVLSGAVVPGLNAGYMGSIVSARTVLGQRANGDILIVLFEGVSGVSGVTADEVGPVMLALGCEIAFICEAGGSTQAWWNSYYAHGSSDQNGFRTMPSAFIIDAVTENEYDSGWVDLPAPAWSTGPAQGGPQLQLRQVGPIVNLKMNVGGFSHGGTLTTIPARYLPRVAGEARHVALGGGALPFVIFMQGGNTGELAVERLKGLVAGTPDPISVAGMMSWFQRL